MDVQQELIRQIEEAHALILDILAQIDDIALQQNPRIAVDYAIKVGVWENELLGAQIEARRANAKECL